MPAFLKTKTSSPWQWSDALVYAKAGGLSNVDTSAMDRSIDQKMDGAGVDVPDVALRVRSRINILSLSPA